MGRKKRKQLKPWCWYCNREFDDEKILIQHQKAKHFKCPFCHRKLFTGPGLSIHCNQVHKEKLDKIPNALPNRTSTSIDIYGMVGIPEVDQAEHERQKLGGDIEEPAAKVGKMDDYVPPPAIPFLPGMCPPMPGPYVPVMNIHPPMGAVPLPPPPPPPPPSVPLPPPPVEASPISAENTPKATFPAYSSPSIATKAQVPKVPKPSAGANGVAVELVHPDEDLSLEELRAEVGKYKSLLDASIAPPAPPPISTAPLMPPMAPVPMGMMHPMGMHPMMYPTHMPPGPGFVPAPGVGIPAMPHGLPPWPGMPPMRF